MSKERYEYPKDFVVLAAELRLADIVQYADNVMSYGTMTVEYADADKVVCFRQYTHTAHFSTGNSVSCYIGVERVEFRRDTLNMRFKVLQRETLD